MKNRAYIGVGSNLGDRENNIQKSFVFLTSPVVMIKQISSLYNTPALCRRGEAMPDFLNAVCEVETDLDPLQLLDALESIEKKMGRSEKGNWQPRIIDLDLLLYNDLVLKTEKLILPHPEMHRREFVLRPLCDLIPKKKHPVLQKTFEELLKSVCV